MLSTACRISDNPVSSLCIEYRAQGSEEFQTVTTLQEDDPANSVTFQYDWDVSDLATGDYEVRFTATDLVGLESEPVTVSYHIRHYAAPAVGQITLTGQPEYQSAIRTWTYAGDSYFVDYYEIYRNDVLVTTTKGNHFADTIESTATYKVRVVDIYDNKAESNSVTVTPKEDEIPPEAIIAEQNVFACPNSELTFDGTLSTDNVGVVSYEWDFGDETAIVEGSTATHAYTQEGTYTVTLTVKDAKENADTATTTVTVEATSRTVEFTTKYLATGSETAQILGNTDITIASTKENEQEILLRSDENGKATTALKPGNYIVSALCGAAKLSGYVLYVAPEEDDTAVQQEELVLTRVRSGGLEGSLTVHEMQYQEIVDAGIDITNPDNLFVYKYEAKFIYGNNGGTADPISFDYYVNSSGSCLGYSGGGGSGNTSTKPSASVSGTGGEVTADDDGTVTIAPDEGYQIVKITVNGEEIDIPADGKLVGLTQSDKVVVTFEKIAMSTLPFADVMADDWFHDAVQYVYEKGMMNGTSATTFAPDDTMTRAMLVTILHRQAGEPVVNYALPFTDVESGTWYTEAVRWAASEGVVTGTSATTFEPDAPVTREQFAAILYRYA